MKGFLRRCWPLLAALSILWITVALLLSASLRRDAGHLVYPIDDTYIHMALAKNLAQHGVWGVTPYGFTSSTSSMLWTLLLGLTYFVFGVQSLSPLVLNVIFGSLVLLVAYGVICVYTRKAWYTLAVLAAVIYLTPVPSLIFAGIEHNLHTALTLLTTFLAARWLSEEDSAQARRDFRRLLGLAFLTTATRPEGMFLALVASSLFFLRKKFSAGLALGACGFAPVVIYGLFSVWHGWYFLPSSVLLKGNFPDFATLGTLVLSVLGPAYLRVKAALHVFVLILAALALFVAAVNRKERAWDSQQLMAAMFAGAAVLHLAFSETGWFYRYEAYLVALGLVVVACQVTDWMPREIAFVAAGGRVFPRKVATAALVALLLYPLAVRGAGALWFTPQATNNIFEQQYQMGIFIRQYYEGSTVALNDIGAVNYLADIHCLDLWGLANLTVTTKRSRGSYHTADIDILARQAGVRSAIVYDSWYAGPIGGLPRSWVNVGRWTILNNVAVGDSTVSFYAADPSEAPALIEHLRNFRDQLPPDVIQTGRYTQGP